MTPAPMFEEAVSVSTLTYAYPGHIPIITGATLHLPPGSRCLMVGANGAGKTTLLQILAGKHMVGEGKVHVLGRSAFHDIDLISSGELSYLGPQWKRDVGCVGSDVPLQGDLSAEQLIFGVEGVDPERRDCLIELLDVDLGWRLNRVSDGQRRRVQICLGLLRPYRVLLLDEVTVDMDVVGRLDLLAFFTKECAERGATIIYATHIFDGLEGWVTHLAYIAGGALVEGGPVGAKADLRPGHKLLPTVQAWLRAERNARHAEEASDPWARERRPGAAAPAAQLEVPRKHMMYFRG